MADLNVWSITGRLTKDADFRMLASGKYLLTCDVAVNTGWGEHASVVYARVQQWGERGQKLARYLTKGKPVAVSGTLSLNTWTGRDGKERQQLVLDATSIQFLPDGGGKDAPVQTEREAQTDERDELDAIPF